MVALGTTEYELRGWGRVHEHGSSLARPIREARLALSSACEHGRQRRPKPYNAAGAALLCCRMHADVPHLNAPNAFTSSSS